MFINEIYHLQEFLTKPSEFDWTQLDFGRNGWDLDMFNEPYLVTECP